MTNTRNEHDRIHESHSDGPANKRSASAVSRGVALEEFQAALEEFKEACLRKDTERERAAIDTLCKIAF